MDKQINFNLKEIDLFRNATSEDIVEGNVVYLIGYNDELFKKVIIEVLTPRAMFKAFCADDGCRYGLEDLYVLNSHQRKQFEYKVIELENEFNLSNKLNELGVDGWEIVNINHWGTAINKWTEITMKREI